MIATAGPYRSTEQFENAAPKIVARFRGLMPYTQEIVHVRWSREACWIPLGELSPGLRHENATASPAPGQSLLYPGDLSETEVLLAYSRVTFTSKLGQFASDCFMTVNGGLKDLVTLGRMLLWQGAQDIRSALEG